MRCTSTLTDDALISSGGIGPDFAIPSWQHNVANLQALGGSTTNRNYPDVAMAGDGTFVVFTNAAAVGQGTSAAAPLWAGFTALVNQQAAANGNPPVGFLNPALYAIGTGTNYASCFHDVTSGNSIGAFCPVGYYAASGYDLCTGWGSPNGLGLIRQLAGPVWPVAWWQGEQNANDYFGRNNGTAMGGVGYAQGKVANAFVLNGTNAYVYVPASPTLNVAAGGSFTLEGWIYPADTEERPIAEWNSGATAGVQLWMSVQSAGSLYANVADYENHIFSSSPGTVATGTWQHVALTYDQHAGACLYTNGQLAAQATLSQVPTNLWPWTATAFYLGARPNTSYLFNGMLDEMSVYDRALPQTAIQGIYLAGAAGKLLPTAPVPPPAGLVAWWQGEQNPNDSFGLNDGIQYGALNYAPGEVKEAFQFNGLSACVRVPASSVLNVGSDAGFTVETWINPSSTASGQPLVEWNNGSTYGAHLWLYPAGGTLYANIVDTGLSAHTLTSASGAVVADTWQHVALTYDKTSGQAFLYLNGAQVAQASPGTITPLTTADLYFGERPGPGTPVFYGGLMDEVSLYERALTPLEVLSIYDSGTAGKLAPTTCVQPATHLVSWWRGEGNATDYLGLNNGAAQGALGYGAGEVNQGFAFNGNNAAVEVSPSSNLNVGASAGFTIEAWINPSNTASAHPLIEWNNGTTIGAHLWLYPGGGSLYANVIDANQQSHVLSGPAGMVMSNAWQHVALTYSQTSGYACLYFNGAQVAQLDAGVITPLTTAPLYLGERPGPGTPTWYAGLMDEVGLYNNALTAQQILAIYDAGSGGKCAN
jgi:hypothetical protein